MIGSNWQLIVGYSLLTIAALYYTGPLVLGVIRRTSSKVRPTTNTETANSVAPAGFAAHVAAIKAVAASATAAEREQYYEEALTRTQTLEREVTRLSGGPI